MKSVVAVALVGLTLWTAIVNADQLCDTSAKKTGLYKNAPTVSWTRQATSGLISHKLYEDAKIPGTLDTFIVRSMNESYLSSLKMEPALTIYDGTNKTSNMKMILALQGKRSPCFFVKLNSTFQEMKAALLNRSGSTVKTAPNLYLNGMGTPMTTDQRATLARTNPVIFLYNMCCERQIIEATVVPTEQPADALTENIHVFNKDHNVGIHCQKRPAASTSKTSSSGGLLSNLLNSVLQ